MSAPYLDDSTFCALRDFVRELTGIHFADNKRYLLENRVRRSSTRAGVSTGVEYLRLLQSESGAAELSAFISEITTNETSFFRHSRQIDILRHILSGLISSRDEDGMRSLSLWSAACSTGEEPYTVAMLLADLIDDLDSWKIEFLATDISSEHIDIARAGQYSERQLRSLPEEVHCHLAPVGETGGGRIVEEVRQLVRFEVGNLTQPPPLRDTCDLVLCRNVLIYFDGDTKQQVIGGLRQALRPGGYLVLGPSDSLQGVDEGFDRTPHSTYNFYVRSDTPAAVKHIPTKSTPEPDAAARDVPPPPAAAPGPSSTESLHSRMLALRLDHGLQALSRDMEASVDRALECVVKTSENLRDLASSGDLAPQQLAILSRAGRQLERTLVQLQVGDRGQQKVEAIRALLQELLDSRSGEDQTPVHLGVETTRFDPAILEDVDESAAEPADRELSQAEIDALFD